MALGSNYNNNKDDKNKYSPTVYSRYGFGNPESEIDPSRLSASFWNNMLKLTISPRKQSNDQSVISYDSDNAVAIYLSHTKANLFYQEICEFEKNPDLYQNLGINSGEGLLSICNGKEYGINCPCIVIKKIDGATGECKSSYAYQIKQGYHYAVRNFEQKTNDFDKVYYDTIEIDELKLLLKTYYEAMTCAAAYSVIDNSKYDFSRVNTKLELIGDKMGVEFGKKGGYSNSKSSSSIFNTKEPRNFSSSSLEDIESQIG